MKNKCARVRLVIRRDRLIATAQTRSARGTLAFRGKVVRLLENREQATIKEAATSAIKELLDG